MGREDYTKKVLDFYKKCGDEKILDGKVWIQGRQIEIPDGRFVERTTQFSNSLCFEPGLRNAPGYDSGCMDVLVKYLENYQPIDRRGLIFFPSAGFSLRAGKGRLSLAMQAEEAWSQGVIIDVFNRREFDGEEFDEIIQLMQGEKPSTFVCGKLREKRDMEDYTLLRRYFPE